MKKFFAIAAAALVMASCGDSNAYKVTAYVGQDALEKEAVLINFDNGDTLATALVSDTIVTLTGSIQLPTPARLLVDGQRYGTFILESGDITLRDKVAKGTALNDTYAAWNETYSQFVDSVRGKYSEIKESMSEEEIASFFEIAEAQLDSMTTGEMLKHIANPVGYFIFLDKAYELEVDAFKDYIAKYPQLADYKRVKTIQESYEAKERTSEGHPYVDFEIVNGADTVRLSDYVVPGNITLVDFWASWCGPCKREIENIKEIYKTYSGKNFEVVGVAVWEDADKTQAWLQDNPLPWKLILNAQSVPTELYGINGIPCLVVIGEDGTIIARDKRGDELEAFIAQQMNKETE